MPDYQRLGGDYNSWFIRKEGSDTFLSGFEAWEEIDGALTRLSAGRCTGWVGTIWPVPPRINPLPPFGLRSGLLP